MRPALSQYMAAAVLFIATGAVAYGQAQPERSTADRTTTIVGCLVHGPSQSVEEFLVQTPAIAVPAGTPVSVGGSAPSSSGRASTSAGTPTEKTAYRIAGLPAADLKPHLGHRVEVQGTLSQNTPPATTAKTTQDPKTGRATTAVTDDWKIAGVLNATALKMIAASCQ